jgi:hypothetical protein
MYSQLVKELTKWEKCQKKWLKEHPKKNQRMTYVILP